MKERSIILLSIFIILLSVAPGSSQIIGRRRAKLNEYPPKAILVELSTETNRIQYLKKIKNQSAARTMQHDADSVITKMVADFTAHFNFCPVFFFYDTAAPQIARRNFAGVLMDKNLQSINDSPISPDDSSYFIVYYGYESQNTSSDTKDIYSGNYSDNTVLTLVAMDYTLHQLRSPLPYKANMGLVKNKSTIKKQLASYAYLSKRYNISYQPLALFYDATLKNYYDPLKVIHKYKKS